MGPQTVARVCLSVANLSLAPLERHCAETGTGEETIMTTTEHAATIRATLKRDHGWTGRQVSVRSDLYSMGSSIRVVIRDPSVPIETVRRVAMPAEKVDRDQFGEILSGGNRYVEVSYDWEVLETMGRHYVDAVQVAKDALGQPDTNRLIPIGATGYLLGWRENGLHLWSETSHVSQHYTVENVAQELAILAHGRGA